ncbi:xanthine dehydrogenase family protein molybdopterin-binding subunit [Falsiroseomonas oryzae]|uniref:xanthine dehydrogenase family protein molybdopterin-binding subunit n=1 Tax=Falsiroseomonas oryzae TaxID=2766473 RepID=UPI0022EADB6B|nr:xanthine dehydrogenase family protein molybdopterin-binding subunit [Roseomonas sp. MO-31]
MTENPWYVGGAPRRVEDPRLLRGLGRYSDDIAPRDALHAVFLRSPHAAARIAGIDTKAARALPGVVAVVTAEDLADVAPLPCLVPRHLPDGSPMPRPPYCALSGEAVRHVGDPVALVVATSQAAARDGAEAVAVDWEPLPAVTDAEAALSPGAPEVWPGLPAGNLCFEFRLGDHARVAQAIASAPHVVSFDARISRVCGVPMEPRAAIAEWDEAEGRYTLRTSVQVVHTLRDLLAAALGVPASAMRVVSPDMGGGFGLRSHPTQEQLALLRTARALRRPIRWVADRTEAMLSDAHARDTHNRIELALDAEGTFLALRVTSIANLGAYLGTLTPHSSTNNLGGLSGVYRTPLIAATVRGAFTNTQPQAPYRGAGRPEASYAIERAIDIAAARLGIDRLELRRRNLIPAAAMPWRTGFVFTYDSGDFAHGMAMAEEAADLAGFPTRKAASEARGMLRGLGIANAIEISAGPPGAPMDEGAELRIAADGSATLLLGTHNHGQGHETAFRQVLAERLGIAPDRLRIVAGDTDLVPHGRGTFGSRSLVAGGAATVAAIARVVERGKRIAAHLLEAAPADIEFTPGRFAVAGTDRAVTLDQVARAAHTPGARRPGEDAGLAAQAAVTPGSETFPNGCHICEVEVDPETGAVRLDRYTVVDDVGTVVNPLLLKGQIQGGVAQGAGQALMEEIRYDEAGQMLTASFMDYAMPRAADLPFVQVLSNPQPTAGNPLGAKGAGEAGTVGALPVVISAVCDAIGVPHLDMPATPERVWRALAARGT